MDPPPTSVAANDGSCGGKVRLLCSYGGRIVPRPRTKSFCYAGGETRIVAVDRHIITTLSSFISHLASTLSLNFTFTLKYQLPHLHLESLISVTSDDDFQILIDEYDRLCSSTCSTPSRIRVFLFPNSVQPSIHHPKTESWFFDALKSAKIMQKGSHCLMGPENESHGCCPVSGASGEGRNSGGEMSHGLVSSGAESVVLETSSSFGSTSSSTSLSNLPPLRAHGEENEANLQESRAKFTPSDTLPSDNTVSNVLTQHRKIPYEEPAVLASSMDIRVNAEPAELQSKTTNISSGIIVNNTDMSMQYTSVSQLNQVQRQHAQFVQAGSHIIPHITTGPLYGLSYQQIYQPQQHLIYHPNQPYPVYLVPIGQLPPNTLPMHYGGNDTVTASAQAPLHFNRSFMTPHVAHNVEEVARPQFAPDFASLNCRTANAATSIVHAHPSGSQQHEMDFPPMYNQCQAISNDHKESPKGNGHDDDLAFVDIYKSQPPAPKLPSYYQTMTKASTVLLSEAFDQLHVNDLKQQTETSWPQ